MTDAFAGSATEGVQTLNKIIPIKNCNDPKWYENISHEQYYTYYIYLIHPAFYFMLLNIYLRLNSLFLCSKLYYVNTYHKLHGHCTNCYLLPDQVKCCLHLWKQYLNTNVSLKETFVSVFTYILNKGHSTFFTPCMI